jgi:acylphosphatase
MNAKKWTVSGRVQGVGYRNFVQRAALPLGLRGYAKNLANGDVEVVAVGAAAALDELAGQLRIGPRWGEVRTVSEEEVTVASFAGFSTL